MRIKGVRSSIPLTGVKENGGNVPCLRTFFRCLETSGLSMSDTGQTGLVITPAEYQNQRTVTRSHSLLFHPDLGAVQPDIGTETGDSTEGYDPVGAFADIPAGYSAIMLAAGRTLKTTDAGVMQATANAQGFPIVHLPMGTNRFTISTQTNFHAYVQDASGLGGPNCIATDPLNLQNPSWDTDYIICAEYETGVGLTSTFTEMDNPAAVNSITAADTGSAAFPMVTSQVTRPNGLKMYGWAMFLFSGALPSDKEPAKSWMSYQWRDGNRYLWPGWVNRD